MIQRIVVADSAPELDAFMAELDPQVTMRIGSQSAFRGHAAVGEAIAGLFSGLRRGIEHRLINAWDVSGMLVYQAEAPFHLQGGRDTLCLMWTRQTRAQRAHGSL